MTAEMPLNWLNPSLFIIFVYWMTDLNSDPANFFLFWVLLIINVELAVSIGMLVSAAVTSPKKALVMVSILVLGSMLLGGFYVDHGNIPIWLRWIQWLSFIKYTFGSLATTAFDDNLMFDCSENSEFSVCNDGTSQISGHDVLDQRNIENIPVVYAMVVFFGIIVIKFATYFTLFFRYKPKSPTY